MLAIEAHIAIYRSKAQYMGRKLVAAMKDKLGKQLFEVIIQASANGDIIARETIKVSWNGCAQVRRVVLQFLRHPRPFLPVTCSKLASAVVY